MTIVHFLCVKGLNKRNTYYITTEMFSCSHEECGATFKKRWRLVEHTVKHTGEKPFACSEDECDKRFSRKSHLQRHVKSHSASKDFECQEEACKKRFVANESLKRHIKRVHQDKQFKCTWPDCGKTFKKHQQLKYHACQHSGNLPHLCDYEGCEKAFTAPRKLKAHKKTHEGYTCDVPGCGAVVFKWSLMRKHKSEIHNSDFPCENCGKVFKTKSKLKSHSKIHDSEREVFECPYQECQRSYTRVLYLQQHVDNYHQGARPFACSHDGCVKTFANKVSLVKHHVVHEPGYCKPPAYPKRKRSLASRLSGFPDAATRSRKNLVGFYTSRKVSGKLVLDVEPKAKLYRANELVCGTTKSEFNNETLSHDLNQNKITCESVKDEISVLNLTDNHERSEFCGSKSFKSEDVVLEKRPRSEILATEHGDLLNISRPSVSNETMPLKVVTEVTMDRNDIWTAISEKVVDLLEKSVIHGEEINSNSILGSGCSEGNVCKLDDSSLNDRIIQMGLTSVKNPVDSSVNIEEMLHKGNIEVKVERECENITIVRKLLDGEDRGSEETKESSRDSTVDASCNEVNNTQGPEEQFFHQRRVLSVQN